METIIPISIDTTSVMVVIIIIIIIIITVTTVVVMAVIMIVVASGRHGLMLNLFSDFGNMKRNNKIRNYE